MKRKSIYSSKIIQAKSAENRMQKLYIDEINMAKPEVLPMNAAELQVWNVINMSYSFIKFNDEIVDSKIMNGGHQDGP